MCVMSSVIWHLFVCHCICIYSSVVAEDSVSQCMWHLLWTCCGGCRTFMKQELLLSKISCISSEPSCLVSQRTQRSNVYWKSAMCFAKALCLSETSSKEYVDCGLSMQWTAYDTSRISWNLRRVQSKKSCIWKNSYILKSSKCIYSCVSVVAEHSVLQCMWHLLLTCFGGGRVFFYTNEYSVLPCMWHLLWTFLQGIL